MKTFLAVLGATLLVSLRTVLMEIALALVGKKVVEWAMLGLLRWLAKNTKSKVDDKLLKVVKSQLEGESEPAPESNTKCPNCGYTMD